jgi:hypothetical protein
MPWPTRTTHCLRHCWRRPGVGGRVVPAERVVVVAVVVHAGLDDVQDVVRADTGVAHVDAASGGDGVEVDALVRVKLDSCWLARACVRRVVCVFEPGVCHGRSCVVADELGAGDASLDRLGRHGRLSVHMQGVRSELVGVVAQESLAVGRVRVVRTNASCGHDAAHRRGHGGEPGGGRELCHGYMYHHSLL